MSAPKAGENVRASHYPKVRVIKKAATESVTSSTTLQNDDDFSISLDADKTYRIQTVLAVAGAAAGDIKVAWTLTGGVALLGGRHVIGPPTSTTDASATTLRDTGSHTTGALAFGLDGTNAAGIREDFLVETTTAGTSGTLTMQWAQNASSGTATQLSGNSYMVVTEVDLL